MRLTKEEIKEINDLLKSPRIHRIYKWDNRLPGRLNKDIEALTFGVVRDYVVGKRKT